jgi:DNA modification methylase
MSTELVALSDLARRINAEHEACLAAAKIAADQARIAVDQASEVGRLLVEAKGQVEHGEWAPWVETNCSFGLREAQHYMRVFNNRGAIEEQKRNGVSHLTSLRQAVEALAEPKEPPDQPKRAVARFFRPDSTVPPNVHPNVEIVQGDAAALKFPDESFDLVLGSPPYMDARLYLENGQDLRISRDCQEWIDWMLIVTAEALRVSRGLVVWIVGGRTEDWCYQPGPEGLLYEWWKRGGSALRPCYWHRPGIPGSGGEQWYASRIEYALAFKRPGKLPWADPVANGHPPKYAPGGEMSYRQVNGERVNRNKFGGPMGRRENPSEKTGLKRVDPAPSHTFGYNYGQNGREEWPSRPDYEPPAIANPGNLISTGGGHGHLGSDLAHENEAPFPEALAAWFIRSHCPPGGRVLDPFGGSGTTAAAAVALDRHAVTMDLRQSQCDLAARRLATEEAS